MDSKTDPKTGAERDYSSPLCIEQRTELLEYIAVQFRKPWTEINHSQVKSCLRILLDDMSWPQTDDLQRELSLLA